VTVLVGFSIGFVSERRLIIASLLTFGSTCRTTLVLDLTKDNTVSLTLLFEILVSSNLNSVTGSGLTVFSSTGLTYFLTSGILDSTTLTAVVLSNFLITSST